MVLNEKIVYSAIQKLRKLGQNGNIGTANAELPNIKKQECKIALSGTICE